MPVTEVSALPRDTVQKTMFSHHLVVLYSGKTNPQRQTEIFNIGVRHVSCSTFRQTWLSLWIYWSLSDAYLPFVCCLLLYNNNVLYLGLLSFVSLILMHNLDQIIFKWSCIELRVLNHPPFDLWFVIHFEISKPKPYWIYSKLKHNLFELT